MEQLFSLLINGLSISSVLLLVALGLSIAFGMMGVINFAHGEFIMIGAYTAYMVTSSVQGDVSIGMMLLILLLAFLLAALIGYIIEWLVIRHLYGRPNYSILATWGLSLFLQQLVRSIFGANNVEVKAPALLMKGVQLSQGLQLPYNRLAIFGLSLLVCVAAYYFLYKSRYGRLVQAVMQNRDMAACMGIRVRRVDALTFAFGCGIAGIAGVAISLLGSIGPSTGQNYIIDAFLVVILGGVGSMKGTILGALLIGILNPYFEYITTSSMGKVILLIVIITVLQIKPTGLSPLKDRSLD
jgi:urea transport system permease protein